jgi:hypothetical protein
MSYGILGFANVSSQRVLGSFPIAFRQFQQTLREAAASAFMTTLFLRRFPQTARRDQTNDQPRPEVGGDQHDREGDRGHFDQTSGET